MSRILRSLVCLLLICCILVNLSPLKAHALDPVTVGFVGVSAVVGVACIMQALGYMAASNSEPFTNSVNACVDYLTESTSFVTNGMLTFAGYRSGQLSSMYAMRDLFQEVWQWLFDSCTVVYTPLPTFPPDSDASFADAWATASLHPYAFYVTQSDGSSRIYYSDVEVYRKNSTSLYTIDGNKHIYGWNGSAWSMASSNVYAPEGKCTIDWFGTSVPEFSTLSSDIFLGQIQSPYQTVGTDEEIIEIEIAPVYIDLTKEVQEFPDPNNPSDDPDLDKKIPWLPIRIPSKNYDDTVINQTQQESWTGESEVEFEFDYGDSSGNGSGNTGNNSWTPSGDMQHFTLDLKEYFPFCIPFDLYDFFTCLNADPVAPVIEWVIPLPGGDTYPLELDLSTFDPVAQLLRRLQLLLFCVGLAFKTRDLIKG